MGFSGAILTAGNLGGGHNKPGEMMGLEPTAVGEEWEVVR